MNEVEALPQMMLQQVAKDVMLRINDVALRANGVRAFTLCAEVESVNSQSKCNSSKALAFTMRNRLQ